MNIQTKYKEVINKEKGGLELYFETIPTYQERQTLKENGFKWSNFNKCWYIKLNGKALVNKEIKTKHNLKVGDILESSWGYEQTNNTFYRVEKLKGQTMIVVKEVYLKIKERESTGSDAENRIYDINNWSYADKEEITRKVKNNYQDNRPEGDYIEPESYSLARKYNGEKIYCSWYY